MKKTIINKVPHPVYILDDTDSIIKMFPQSTGMIRLDEHSEDIGKINGIPICNTTWLNTASVPPAESGIYYIVSQLVKNAMPERPDFLVPKDVVRDNDGNIIGCRKLDLGPHKIH